MKNQMLSVLACYFNMIAVGVMTWWAFGMSKNNEFIVQQLARKEINARAQEICNQCIQQFARQQGLEIMGRSE